MTFRIAAALLPITLATPVSAESLKLMHFFPDTLQSTKTDAAFADEVEQATDGRIDIKIFWSGQLGKATEVLDLVGTGAVEMGATLPNYFPADLPFSSLGAVPLGYFGDTETALNVERAVIADPATQAELDKVNLVPVLIHGLPTYHLICTKPVATVADLDGLKVRTFGAFAPAALSELGAVPVNLQPSEVYEGLQRGTVDCVMYSYEFAASNRLHEVAKDWSTIPFGSFAGYQLYINRDVLDEIDPADREALLSIGRDMEQAEVAKVRTAEAEAIKTAEAAGVTFTDFTEIEQLYDRMSDTLDAWARQTKEKGAKAEDVDRIVALVRAEAGHE